MNNNDEIAADFVHPVEYIEPREPKPRGNDLVFIVLGAITERLMEARNPQTVAVAISFIFKMPLTRLHTKTSAAEVLLKGKHRTVIAKEISVIREIIAKMCRKVDAVKFLETEENLTDTGIRVFQEWNKARQHKGLEFVQMFSLIDSFDKKKPPARRRSRKISKFQLDFLNLLDN